MRNDTVKALLKFFLLNLNFQLSNINNKISTNVAFKLSLFLHWLKT